MGNTNQGSSSIATVQGDKGRQRRPSTSEPMGPLEVPLGTHRYNVDTTPPSSQAIFGKNLAEQVSIDNEADFLRQNLQMDRAITPRPSIATPSQSSECHQYARRYRAGSISVEAQSGPLLASRQNKIPAVLKWDRDGKSVSISGSFNNWEKKIPLVKSEKNFYTIIEVPEGEHQYRFFVDGQWKHNPNEPTIKNSSGSINNVLKVSKDDFEFLQALETDREAATKNMDPIEALKSTTPADNPNIEYTQEVPTRKSSDRMTGPPVLPPHLLQVILNKDVPEHLEPGLLPEPNHVMLNHLYALSIKDGVMVLSDTSRYKKKYVTTLLYKPIDS